MKKRHRKAYRGNGVVLLCGDKVEANSPYRGANFSISGCSKCGMEVKTTGCSPDTDEVSEFYAANIFQALNKGAKNAEGMSEGQT